MKKHIFIPIVVWFLTACLISCTFHIKSKELEIDAKPPEAKIGNETEINHTYELVAIDFLKNAAPDKTRRP